jgi:hypothetical protein
MSKLRPIPVFLMSIVQIIGIEALGGCKGILLNFFNQTWITVFFFRAGDAL